MQIYKIITIYDISIDFLFLKEKEKKGYPMVVIYTPVAPFL